ncbi:MULTISPECIES: hypothetical protein [unclassified Nocardioides]|uniref:hypothetical protein n=1 Tax=unclassified Nocardioides TaxID=2615069 RepID=UPI0000EB6046|nr:MULTISPECIES: hypothetical protein [unclassified Nocardioides]ABL79849.1 hypothetical protein Noca_0304 [Nocardioides sp. JS614]
MAGTHAPADILALSVHGPVGVLDLVVPGTATAADVAEEYAVRAGLDAAPVLRSRLGHGLEPATTLARAGVVTGDLLVADPSAPGVPADRAAEPVAGGRHAARSGPAADGSPRPRPDTLPMLGLAVAAAAAGLAGWCAATAPGGALRATAIGLLLVAAVLGVLPIGRRAAHRVVAAPAFGAAAAFAMAWDPHGVRLPMVLGVTGLAAALVAAVGRALAARPGEALRVWVLAGVAGFVGTGLASLGGAPPRLVWSLVLLGALLAARFVPAVAVDVPDQYLIDLDRLAVTAWSAREQPSGRRGRTVVPLDAVDAVAARGTRIVTAASAAVLAAVLLSAPLLLAAATLPIDRVGARVLVGCAGAGLLLAARSYRHAAARALLRIAGLACGTVLATALLGAAGRAGWWLAGLAVLTAAALVVAAVAVGRGWRSAWWSRRAEVAEGLAGATAVGALVVASGWFRQLWELASLWKLGA